MLVEHGPAAAAGGCVLDGFACLLEQEITAGNLAGTGGGTVGDGTVSLQVSASHAISGMLHSACQHAADSTVVINFQVVSWGC